MTKKAFMCLVLVACCLLPVEVAVASIPNNLACAPDLFLVGTGRALSLFFSSDEGQTFIELESLPDGVRYGVFPRPSGGAWLATSNGLYSSNEGLRQWEQVLERPVAWVTCSPNGLRCLYKVWGAGLVRTDEEGLQPGALRDSRVSVPLPVDALPQSAVVTDSGVIIVGFFGQGVFRTSDDGSSWEPMAAGLLNSQVLGLAIAHDQRLYASLFGGGLWVWHEEESLWQLADPVFQRAIVETIAVGDDGSLLAGTREEGLVVSRDRGSSWQQAEGLPNSYVQGTAITSDGSWWCYIPDYGLYVSRDQGELWESKPFAFVNRVQQVALDETGRWYGTITGVGLVTSEDKGETFEILSLPVRWDSRMLFFLSPTQELMLAWDTDLWISKDKGQTWHKDEKISGKGPISFVGAGPDQTVYVVVNKRAGIYAQQEQGWRQVLAVEPWNDSYRVWEMLFAPSAVVAHGAYEALRMQHDGTWIALPFGQRQREFFFLADGTLCAERAISTFYWDVEADRWPEVSSVPVNERFRWWAQLPQTKVMAGPFAGIVRIENDGALLHDDTFATTRIMDLTANFGGEILVGTVQGFWYSSDQGDNWEQIMPSF